MKEIEEMTLEEAMKKLEDTAAKLEDSKLSLDKSIDTFEQGVKLIAHCRELLEGYQQRITVLKKEGTIKEIPMEEALND